MEPDYKALFEIVSQQRDRAMQQVHAIELELIMTNKQLTELKVKLEENTKKK